MKRCKSIPPHQRNRYLFVFHRAEAPDWFRQAMEIRNRVFVDEQSVPQDHEQDDWDDTAIHFLLSPSEDPGKAMVTARMFTCPADPAVVKIGRMAVLKEHRGQGLGQLLLEYVLEEAIEMGFKEALLDAQTHALEFYGKLGFAAEGDEFLDENIPHYRMRKRLNPVNTELNSKVCLNKNKNI